MYGESKHHMLYPRADYRTKHEKSLRRQLIMPMDWESHCELHAKLPPPDKPDIGIILCVIDYLDEKQPSRDDAPLYAIERLEKLGNREATDLADHFIIQLGFLGVMGDGLS